MVFAFRNIRTLHLTFNLLLTRLSTGNQSKHIRGKFLKCRGIAHSLSSGAFDQNVRGGGTVLERSLMHFRGVGHLNHFNVQEMLQSFVVQVNHAAQVLILSRSENYMLKFKDFTRTSRMKGSLNWSMRRNPCSCKSKRMKTETGQRQKTRSSVESLQSDIVCLKESISRSCSSILKLIDEELHPQLIAVTSGVHVTLEYEACTGFNIGEEFG